jgi:protein O-mannosyl-transferase
MKSRRLSVMAKAPPALPVDVDKSVAHSRTLSWRMPISVIVVSALAFAPVVQNDFVNWDDRVNLLDNRFYRGLSWDHLAWMFTTFHNSLYRPLTWITLGADYSVWGMNPAGYHLTSLLLHCVAAWLFYLLSIRLLSLVAPKAEAADDRAIKVAAGFAALFFAVHPLRVEPIAWASGRENVVAGPFFILTFICYLRAVEAPLDSRFYWKWMVAAWFSYGLSLLGKGAGVTLPIALLILDFYPLQRLSGPAKKWLGRNTLPIYLEKAPFFMLALAAGLLAVYGKQQSNLMYGLEQYGILQRIVQTVYGLIFYLWKTLLPFDLSNLYEIESLSISDWRFLVSALLLVAISVTLWSFRRRWPWGFAAWVFYCVVLLPYVGVAQNGPQIAADRYSYLACLSWALLAGAGWLFVWRAWRNGRIARLWYLASQAIVLLLIVAFVFLSWRQSQYWRNSETLWRHALAINDRSFFAHHFLASALAAKGRSAAAIEHFKKSLALNPRYASAHVGLAGALDDRGEREKAVHEYRVALELDPNSLVTHYALAGVLAKTGDIDGAIDHYRRALAIDPRDPDTHNNLGLMLAGRGEDQKAIEQFQLALQSDRGYAKAYFNLGRLLVRQGRLDGAIEQFREALRLQPGVAEIHEHLGYALVAQGRMAEARQHLEEAVRLLKTKQSAATR